MKNQNHAPTFYRSAIRCLTGWRTGILISGLITTAANAGVEFYTSPGTFNPAVTAFTFRGTEAWESATGTSAVLFNDPLIPGVANGPFPTGSSVLTGVRAQSNSLGNNPTNTATGKGMFYAPAGFVGNSGNLQPTKQISNNYTNESFDVIFSNLGSNVVRAASLSPMYYRVFSGNNSATLTIRVYNQANQLLGSTNVLNVSDCLENAYLGIVTTGSDTLGRVNVWGTARDVSGADNIAVYMAAPTAPVLNASSKLGNNFNFRLDGQPGQRYAIQSSSNFISWQSLQTNLLSSNSISLTVTATNSLRFFRARWVP